MRHQQCSAVMPACLPACEFAALRSRPPNLADAGPLAGATNIGTAVPTVTFNQLVSPEVDTLVVPSELLPAAWQCLLVCLSSLPVRGQMAAASCAAVL